MPALRNQVETASHRLEKMNTSIEAAEVAKDYVAAIRSLLLEDGNPPLDLPGIRIYENAQAIQASLQRCLDKKGDSLAEKSYPNFQ